MIEKIDADKLHNFLTNKKSVNLKLGKKIKFRKHVSSICEQM